MKRAILAIALGLILAGCLAPAQTLQQRMLPGSAPGFTAATPAGAAWNLTDQLGKTVLIDIMAVDCSACKVQAPTLREVAARHVGDDISMISIEVGGMFPGWEAQEDDALVRFHDEYGLTWPIARDPDGTVFRDYRVLVLPTLIVVRPDGTIQTTLLGDRPLAQIERAIDDARQAR